MHMGTGHPLWECKDNKFITHPQTHCSCDKFAE